ncbi:MAG: hypothetical protein R2825_06060 [Saprospiraceae bacterium]
MQLWAASISRSQSGDDGSHKTIPSPVSLMVSALPPAVVSPCCFPDDPDGDYEALVQDTATWNALTAAQQTYLQQGIYGLLLENLLG